jgi:hypothetical protein
MTRKIEVRNANEIGKKCFKSFEYKIIKNYVDSENIRLRNK